MRRQHLRRRMPTSCCGRRCAHRRSRMRSTRSRRQLARRAVRSIGARSRSRARSTMTIDKPQTAGKLARQAAFRAGLSAESRAAAYLVAHGYAILARRLKSPVGEVDIVARRGKELWFVEVKARHRIDDAAAAVT